MIYERENFQFKVVSIDPPVIESTLPTPENGSIFIDCNLTQFTPDTPIFVGVTDLVFINCNLNNCETPKDAEVDPDCNVCRTIFELGEEIPDV